MTSLFDFPLIYYKMPRYIHFSWQEAFLFQAWVPNDYSHYFGILALSFLIAIAQQALSQYVKKYNHIPASPKYHSMGSKSVFFREVFYIQKASIEALNSLMSIILILLAVTFNAGVIMSIVLGVFFGCFAFSRDL